VAQLIEIEEDEVFLVELVGNAGDKAVLLVVGMGLLEDVLGVGIEVVVARQEAPLLVGGELCLAEERVAVLVADS